MSMQQFPLFLVIIAGLMFMLKPGHGVASAAERETELFNKGYNYLLSYKPDQAAETFRLFLKEFPESSARDAAMFWLAKTLINMKLYGEAELTFQAIQKEFPDSPFMVFTAAEREEIVKLRSAAHVREVRESADLQKDSVPKEANGGRKSQETDRKLAQLLTDKEKAEALLQGERRTNQERMLRIADLEARGSLLKKQNVDLEDQVHRLTQIEINLKESRDERDRLIAQTARLFAEKCLSEADSDNTDGLRIGDRKSAIEGGEASRFRLAQLDMLSEEQGKELTKTREEHEKLKKLIEEEKKLSAGLRADLARSKEKEKVDKEQSEAKEAEKMTRDVNIFKSRVSELQAENKSLATRIGELELQAEQRIRDMRILNSYLTRLMFQKKESLRQEPDPKTSAERDRLETTLKEEQNRTPEIRSQPAAVKEQQAPPEALQERASSPPRAPDAVFRIRNRDYSLGQFIDNQISAAVVFRQLGIRDIAWRAGNPLDDYLSEELLLLEATKNNVTIDREKQKEMAQSGKLSATEVDYLEKFMTIAAYIDRQYADTSSEKWIELLSVTYKQGDAAEKTVPAADLQKAARGGKSFQEIGRMHADGVKFSRLSIQDFSTKYRSKSQIIQKLNFSNEEMVVIWSDKGYTLIKPASGRIPFNPFIEMKTDEKEKIRSFIKKHINELKKKNDREQGLPGSP